MRREPQMITKLDPEEIFVFGSNLRGAHGAGAALQAANKFGAQYGVGIGLTGRCYAFPTLDRNLKKLSFDFLREQRDKLYETCLANPDKRFILTKVGCGLAGYRESQMLILPEDWR
jgi:hypothetical protein